MVAKRRWARNALLLSALAGSSIAANACREEHETYSPGSYVEREHTRMPRTNEDVARREQLLTRIENAARASGAIVDAQITPNDELKVVVGERVKLGEIRPLMVMLLKEMREYFPGRDLSVRSFAPNGEPLATIEYDPSAPSDANVTYQMHAG
jgi:hypothetical protein